jgi:starch phosphorylase
MVLSNPRLANLITRRIGNGWVRNLDELRRLEPAAEDAGFRAAWRDIKRHNKVRLAELIADRTGIPVDPDSLFDVQVKRIHEYKRQHLTALHIVALYHRLKSNPHLDVVPRTFVFGGKAAPGYFLAKLIIRLITAIGETVNRDPQVNDRLRVVFLPNFNVTNAQRVYPAADLSEQVSTAGKEASGTGNMKFQMNGALTIGTMDGANIEIREEVGPENFFLFGLNAAEVKALWARGYHPRGVYERNAELKAVIDLIGDGFFSRGDPHLFRPLVDNLLFDDPYLVLTDFQSYADCQQKVSDTWRDTEAWTRMSILNSLRSGKFSSDRTIRQYCEEIWKAPAVPIQLLRPEQISSGFMQ